MPSRGYCITLKKSLGYSHLGTDKPYKGARDFPATVAGECFNITKAGQLRPYIQQSIKTAQCKTPSDKKYTQG